MEWIDINKELPPNQTINMETGHPETVYYLILTREWGWWKAMRKDNKWYENYTSEVVVEVTHWMKIEYPK